VEIIGSDSALLGPPGMNGGHQMGGVTSYVGGDPLISDSMFKGLRLNKGGKKTGRGDRLKKHLPKTTRPEQKLSGRSGEGDGVLPLLNLLENMAETQDLCNLIG
jgi:hypothetical protein